MIGKVFFFSTRTSFTALFCRSRYIQIDLWKKKRKEKRRKRRSKISSRFLTGCLFFFNKFFLVMLVGDTWIGWTHGNIGQIKQSTVLPSYYKLWRKDMSSNLSESFISNHTLEGYSNSLYQTVTAFCFLGRRVIPQTVQKVWLRGKGIYNTYKEK